MSESLRSLAERMPSVPDRALFELVNGIIVGRALTQHRADLTGIGMLVSRALGDDRQRELLTLQQLLQGQATTASWLNEVSSQVTLSHLAITRVAECLASQQQRVKVIEGAVSSIRDDLQLVYDACNARMDEIDDWCRNTDLRLAANDEVDAIGYVLESPQYRNMPWPYQVLFLARQLASGPAGEWEIRSDSTHLRSLIVKRFVDSLSNVVVPRGGLVLSFALDESCESVQAEEDRWLIAELLDAGLSPELALPSAPYGSLASTAMELSSLPEGGRPLSPGRTALALTRRRLGWIDGSYSRQELIESIVGEQFDTARAVWLNVATL